MRRQINGVTGMLWPWCTNVMRPTIEPMRDVVRMIRQDFEEIVGWDQTRQTNGFFDAPGGLFQAAKRKASGYVRFDTLRVVFFLILGKPDFTSLNPHATRQPTNPPTHQPTNPPTPQPTNPPTPQPPNPPSTLKEAPCTAPAVNPCSAWA